jgi:ADP-heptose:LPS heptosyltransferase
MKINTDCKYYMGNKPCTFHKIDGRKCEGCDDYLKVLNRILIIKLDAMGDVLRTTSVLPALHQKYPNAHITWITKKNAKSLLDQNPYIDRLLCLEEYYLPFVLNEEFDVVISLDPDPHSASILSIARSSCKQGFIANETGAVEPINTNAHEWYWMGLNDELKVNNRKTYFELIYQICELDLPIFKPQYSLTEKAVRNADSFKIKQQLTNKIIGINTGGGNRWQCKKWMPEHYISYIKMLKDKYPENSLLLLGGPEEVDFNEHIVNEVRNLVVDGGCLNSVPDFAALVNLVDVFITPDSLGLHISVALDKNTIVLVGPTSPWELDVFGKGEILYNKEVECISCYKGICPNNSLCMTSLLPETVLNATIKYL